MEKLTEFVSQSFDRGATSESVTHGSEGGGGESGDDMDERSLSPGMDPVPMTSTRPRTPSPAPTTPIRAPVVQESAPICSSRLVYPERPELPRPPPMRSPSSTPVNLVKEETEYGECIINPLTAGAAYIRIFIFISTLSTTF